MDDFKTLISETGSKTNSFVQLMILCSVGFFFDRGSFFDNDGPTFTKKFLNQFDITCPFSVIVSSHLNLAFAGLYFIASMIVLITCCFFTSD